MEGPDRIEAVALSHFPVDGEHATEYLAGWIGAFGVGEGLYLAHAGTSRAEAERLVQSCLAKSRLPEPLPPSPSASPAHSAMPPTPSS
jgi:endonuclease V-like protein UPF0215 family